MINLYRRSFAGLNKNTWMLAVTVLINRSGSVVLFFMTLYLTTQRGFTISEAGRTISIYGLGAVFGAYFGGLLTDKIGPLRVQIYSLLLSTIGYIGLGYLFHPYQIGTMLFFLALVTEAFRPANMSLLIATAPPELRPRAFALNRLAINLGFTIGPALGGFLALYSYKWIFWLDGLTCFGAAIMLYFFFRNRDFRYPAGPATTVPVLSRSPWQDHIFIAVLFLMFTLALMFTQLFNTWPLYLRSVLSYSEDRIGMLLGFNAFLIVLLEMPLIHRLEKLNHLKVMALGAVLLFWGFGLLPFSAQPWYIIFTVVVWSFGEMLVFPLVAGFIGNRASEEHRGKYMGLYTLSFSSAFIFGPAAGTWIYEHWGGNVLWYIALVLGGLVWIGFFIVHNLIRKEQNYKKIH